MKRFEVYWDMYTDRRGASRQIPVMVVSNDFTNNDPNSMCVQTLRLTVEERWRSPVHLFIPRVAFDRGSQIGDCVALCDTVSSTKKSDLFGPVGTLTNPEYQKKVESLIKAHMGMEPMPPMPEQEERPLRPAGMYTGAYGSQTRRTVYQQPQPPVTPPCYAPRFGPQNSYDLNDSITRTVQPNDVPPVPADYRQPVRYSDHAEGQS